MNPEYNDEEKFQILGDDKKIKLSGKQGKL